MSLSKEITVKELLNPALILAVLLIIVGLGDIYHVSSYVRNYEDQFSYNGMTYLSPDEAKSLGITPSYQPSYDLDGRSPSGLNQKEFFNAIFMLCTGFFVTLWGSVKFYLWFERRELLILIEEAKRK